MPTKSFLLALFALTCSVPFSPVNGLELPDPCHGQNVGDPCDILGFAIEGKCKKVAISKDLVESPKGNEKPSLLTKAACLLLQNDQP